MMAGLVKRSFKRQLFWIFLSVTLLPCWASTRFMSMGLGLFTAWVTAFLVTSWNSILFASSGFIPRTEQMCQAMASPSRSGSVARYTLSLPLAAAFISCITSDLPLTLIYSGSKLFSISTAILLLGRSLMWPLEATTLYLLPKNFSIVEALEGDSTMIRFFFNGIFTSSNLVFPLQGIAIIFYIYDYGR